MVRGTYFPLPIICLSIFRYSEGLQVQLTSLGEEGAEALIRISSLALFSQEAVGLEIVSSGQLGKRLRLLYLDAMFEAVKLRQK